jgi:glycyl-tRNA synthetase beta chain
MTEDTLLVELLTEELPPKALARLSQALCEALAAGLRAEGLLADGAQATAYATPRRLAASITRVLARAAERRVQIAGPSLQVGLDAGGKPTPALAGFARKHGVEVAALRQVDTPKGKVFAAEQVAPGARLDDVLASRLEHALQRLPIPKLMRWGDGDAQFVRPVHGLVLLHGGRLLPGRVLGADSRGWTLGHRFLSSGNIAIDRAGDYERVLRERGRVVASFAVRRAEIVSELARAAGDGVELVAGDALFDEITALVEWPAVYEGAFSPEFLEVPAECLVLSMQQHQKYVPLRERASGRLLPRFLFVSNLKADDASAIVRGNERVLRARLADARFFYDQDRKTRLEARVPQLAQVVYHNQLGSQLERVERMQLLAGFIARLLGADPLLAERAAWLAKADLVTGMVGEFPELQGTMGRYYALHDGEPPAVAAAIEAHYLPRFAGDALPADAVALAVALADRLDALAGLFGIGQAPTGDKDPFGLRRAALGVIRMLVERELPLALDALLDAAFGALKRAGTQARAGLEAFVYDRLAGYLREQGYTALEVDAVLGARPPRIDRVPRQLEAVRAFNRLPEAESLAAANKRVVNLLKQAQARGESYAGAGRDGLREPAEIALYDALAAASRQARPLYDRGDYTGYLKTFAVLKAPIDAFFDSIMVMAEDPALRRNRLGLLAELRSEMNRVADIARLAA